MPSRSVDRRGRRGGQGRNGAEPVLLGQVPPGQVVVRPAVGKATILQRLPPGPGFGPAELGQDDDTDAHGPKGSRLASRRRCSYPVRSALRTACAASSSIQPDSCTDRSRSGADRRLAGATAGRVQSGPKIGRSRSVPTTCAAFAQAASRRSQHQSRAPCSGCRRRPASSPGSPSATSARYRARIPVNRPGVAALVSAQHAVRRQVTFDRAHQARGSGRRCAASSRRDPLRQFEFRAQHHALAVGVDRRLELGRAVGARAAARPRSAR